jgi:hypothetical protein
MLALFVALVVFVMSVVFAMSRCVSEVCVVAVVRFGSFGSLLLLWLELLRRLV